MHFSIKSFYRKGTITSNQFFTAKERIIKDIEGEMRDEGYVPVLDYPLLFTRNYIQEEENFEFEITLCGAYIGEEESWLVGGIMNGTKVPRSIHQTK